MQMLIQDTVLGTQINATEVEFGPRRLSTVVVDDSPSFLEVVCALLEQDDELDLVARGQDGIEAIKIVAALRPDLIVMDIDMPHLDGLNAASIISRCFPETKVVLMSAEESPELQADCRACGAFGFVSKTRFRQEFPFLLHEIMAFPCSFYADFTALESLLPPK